jgi:two-component system, OmpR family, sensor histidine kinase KdpD
MTDSRPDPDRLLAKIKDEEIQARRGKLKLFFGASAGVGKTFAMLSAARVQQQQGVDVIIGVIETHGRAETEALVSGLPQLELKEIRYRDRVLREFDLDGALERKPQLVLVDELAHSNVAGSRHAKRWQDVEELLDAGIDVWSAMNVQHLESLNDIVTGITGIRVWETVPDRVFDETDEVVIVDLPPDDLLLRLKEGKVYLPQQAERAVLNFFSKATLIALPRPPLRRTADRVDSEMLRYRRNLQAAPVWQTRESILLCIGPDERSEKLVRTTARLSAQLGVPWHCIYVETPKLQRLPDAARQRVLQLLKTAEDTGAVTATLSGNELAATIVRYAHEHNLPRVVLGRDSGRLRRPWQTPLAEAVGALTADLDILQVALPAREGSAGGRSSAATTSVHQGDTLAWRSYLWSALICGAVTLAVAPLTPLLDGANIVMVFLLAVVGVAVKFGRGPAVLAALLTVGMFDFFYVPPRFSFSVTDAQYLLTFGVMLVVALVIGQLTAGLKFQARVARSREERVGALYAMSRDLSGALMPEQIAEIGARFLKSEFAASAALMIPDLEDRLHGAVHSEGQPEGMDAGVAQWAFDHDEAAGYGTNTLAAAPVLYVPLKAPMRMRGVLAIGTANPGRLAGPEQRRLLDTCASLLAISLERIHYVDVAQTVTVQMESERLRNSLLAAISHDLRTPLAALVGMAESLTMMKLPAMSSELETAHRMKDAALRMNSLVSNMLDMARLQSGPVQLNRQWQPLEEVIGTALKAMSGALDHRPVKVALADDLPLVDIDAVLFERVLCNLLENAAKYTEPRSPINVRAIASDEHVVITVDDTGPGLPKGKESAIFDMFERGRKESSTPGVGLGLAICRAIVEAHGGTIRGETKLQGGARFTIELPRGTPPSLEGLERLDKLDGDSDDAHG